MQEPRTSHPFILTAALALGFLLSACGGQTPGANGATSLTAGTPSIGGSGGSTGGAGGSSNPATGQYLLSWDPVSDSRVTGYKLYYSSAPFSSTQQPNTVDVGTTTTYQFTPSGVSTGTTMYFAVAATGSGLESPLSSAVSVVIQ